MIAIWSVAPRTSSDASVRARPCAVSGRFPTSAIHAPHGPRVVDEPAQPVVDNRRIVVARRPVRIERLNAPVDHCVVRCDAGLAGIGELAEGNARALRS